MNDLRQKHCSDASPGQGLEGDATSTLPLQKKDWIVKKIELDVARKVIERCHYAGGGSNTRVYVFGLFRRDDQENCLGASWWLPPTRTCAVSVDRENPNGVLSLSRLACDDAAPKNSESFLLSHSVRMIDNSRWPSFVTYADGWKNHSGSIYLAAGWKFAGLTKPRPRYLKDGLLVSVKRGPKTKSHWEMLREGCEFLGSFPCKKFVLLKGVRNV
jgi:hypothetical protein